MWVGDEAIKTMARPKTFSLVPRGRDYKTTIVCSIGGTTLSWRSSLTADKSTGRHSAIAPGLVPGWKLLMPSAIRLLNISAEIRSQKIVPSIETL